MLQLVAVEASASRPCAVTKFPFTIGRSRSAGLQLESPGVWDIHASISIRDGKFHVQPEGDSLLLINDERSDGGSLRMGDQLSIGGARISVALSPAVQHGLVARELMILLLVGAVTATQVLLLLSIR